MEKLLTSKWPSASSLSGLLREIQARKVVVRLHLPPYAFGPSTWKAASNLLQETGIKGLRGTICYVSCHHVCALLPAHTAFIQLQHLFMPPPKSISTKAPVINTLLKISVGGVEEWRRELTSIPDRKPYRHYHLHEFMFLSLAVLYYPPSIWL